MPIGLSDIAEEAEVAIVALEDGPTLTAMEEALIVLGLAVSVTSLNRGEIHRAIDEAFAAGATAGQIQEVVSLISGLGVHSLMVTAARIIERTPGYRSESVERLTTEEQALWDRYVGDDPFWAGFERELPRFLESMLRLSPEQFVAFFDYCAVPWKSGQVRARLKELIAMASDATPTHRFLPGFRLHLRNAIDLGAGTLAIRRTLKIAAAAPAHVGTL